VQVKRLDATTAEVKRLYVRPAYRDAGIGARLVEQSCTELRADGFETFRLGVAPYHERAQALYQSFGFEYRPPYEQTQSPEELHDDWNFMERTFEE
jgi:ribosomal protein S18 acetylase RimI-like enzyme